LDFNDFTAQISLRDPENKTKYIGSDENGTCRNAIIESAAEKGLTTVVELGEAASMALSLILWSKMQSDANGN